jgi:hypothetical protein
MLSWSLTQRRRRKEKMVVDDWWRWWWLLESRNIYLEINKTIRFFITE